MSAEKQQHTCHGTPENTFSILFGDDPDQNRIVRKIRHSDSIVEFRVHAPTIARSARAGSSCSTGMPAEFA